MDPSRDSRARTRPSLGRRLARWLRPPRTLRPTRAGWLFFAITFGVGFAALNTGNNLLYLVLSLMLAFLVLSGIMSESALRGIRVRRRLPREIFADAAGTVALEIRNEQRRVPGFAIVVEDLLRTPGGGEASVGRAFALRVGAGERETRGYRWSPERRGRARFGGFRVSTRFPFGMFSKALSLESEEETLVYPAIEVVEPPANFGDPCRDGDQIVGDGGRGVDAAGLREYAAGDAAGRIHWRASARAKALLVREVESEHESEVEVRLQTAGAEPGERFEERVRWAASEVVAFLDAGTRVALRTDADHFEAGHGAVHRARLLTFLALVQPGASGSPS